MDINALVKRARLQRVPNRGRDLDVLRGMLDGAYQPENGDFTPPFKPGSGRHAAWLRAVKTTATAVPVIINKSLAGLDFGNITWSDAETNKDEVDRLVKGLNLNSIARDLATEYRLTGACALMASTPRTGEDTFGPPVLNVLHGVHVPYTDPKNPGTVTGWYRAVEYVNDDGQLRWWVEAYDFVDDETTVHRVWEALRDPTDLALTPNQEFASIARPRFALYGVQPDGLPATPLLANIGRVFGLYATELRLATAEEISAYPMLVTRGDVEFENIGPAEVLAADEDGDARWLEPGDLAQLRDQVTMKRDILREAFNLPGGSLGGGQTPSGEALQEANRGFMQEIRSLANAVETVLSQGVTDYLALHDLPGVSVQLPIDRAYTTASLLDVVEKGVDLGAVPIEVSARMFQQFLGSHYSDEELSKFLADQDSRRNMSTPGFLSAREREAGE